LKSNRLVHESPCRDTRRPKQEPKKVIPLSLEAFEAWREAMPHRFQSVIFGQVAAD